MDSFNGVSERWEQVRARLLSLLDPLALEPAIRLAVDSWSLYLLKGVPLPLSEVADRRLLSTAYRATLFARAFPADYSPDDRGLFRSLDRLAHAVDIYARLRVAAPPRDQDITSDRSPSAPQLARLATVLYTMGHQPTKAYRVSRLLTSRAQPDVASRSGFEDAMARRALMDGKDGQDLADADLETVLMNTALASEQAAEVDSDEEPMENRLAAVDAARFFALTSDRAGRGILPRAQRAAFDASDAQALSFFREYELLSAFHRTADLASVLSGMVSDEYIAACANVTRRERRAELLPPQLWAIRDGLLDAQTVVISTPTGSGKTFMAEIRMAAEVRRDPDTLCVYVAPFNALADQTYRSLRSRLAPAGVQLTLWTGAYEIDDSEISLGNVLVTTPEKLDYLVRAAQEDDPRSLDLVARCRLFVFDEAHLISTGNRGIRYELLTQRLRHLFPAAGVVAISAVISDTGPLAAWLAPEGVEPRRLQLDWQPSAVREILWGADGRLELRGGEYLSFEAERPKAVRSAAALLAATLLAQLPSVLLVETRKDWAQQLAHDIYENFRPRLLTRLEARLRLNPADEGRIRNAVELVKRLLHPKHPLADYLGCGLAFHHAGLPVRVRRVVEQLARDELVHTLVSTTTLAEGMDLAFRAVVMVHLNFPDGPVPSRILRNIRGRAGRPYYANDGIFIVIEPENLDTSAYEHFRSNYWAGDDDPQREPLSSMVQLWDWRAGRRDEGHRILQSQLLALFQEQEVELEDVSALAGRSLLASALGSDAPVVRSLATTIVSEVNRMMEEPAMLRAASPLAPTGLGKQAILGGLSADSARLIRQVLIDSQARLPSILDDKGTTWLAIRLAWIPWEAFEFSRRYKEETRAKPRIALGRSPNDFSDLEDSRLADEYRACMLLLTPVTFDEFAQERIPFVRGRDPLDKLTSAIDWASDAASLLPWTLSGVIRIIDGLTEEAPDLTSLSTTLRPFISQVQTWLPTSFGQELLGLDLSRDQVIPLIRRSSAETPAELRLWLDQHDTELADILSDDDLAILHSWLARQIEF